MSNSDIDLIQEFVRLSNAILAIKRLLNAGEDEAAYHMAYSIPTGHLANLFGEVPVYDPGTTYHEDAKAKLEQLERYHSLLLIATGQDRPDYPRRGGNPP